MDQQFSVPSRAPAAMPLTAPAVTAARTPGFVPARLKRYRSALISTGAFAFGCLVAAMLIAEPSPSRIETPPGPVV